MISPHTLLILSAVIIIVAIAIWTVRGAILILNLQRKAMEYNRFVQISYHDNGDPIPPLILRNYRDAITKYNTGCDSYVGILFRFKKMAKPTPS